MHRPTSKRKRAFQRSSNHTPGKVHILKRCCEVLECFNKAECCSSYTDRRIEDGGRIYDDLSSHDDSIESYVLITWRYNFSKSFTCSSIVRTDSMFWDIFKTNPGFSISRTNASDNTPGSFGGTRSPFSPSRT